MTIAMTDERLFVTIVDFIPLDAPEGHNRQTLAKLYGSLLNSHNNLAGDVLAHSRKELLNIPNFGPKCLPLLEELLKTELGFELERDKPEAWPPADKQLFKIDQARFHVIRAAVIDGVFRPGLLDIPEPAPHLPASQVKPLAILKS